MIIKQFIRSINLALIVFLFSGCGDSRVSECRKIIIRVSSLQEKIQENLASEDLDVIREIAQEFQVTGEQITNDNFKDVILNNYAQDLGLLYQEYAINTLNFISAFEVKDQEKGILYQQQLINLFPQQEKLVNEINQYCQ